MEATVVVYLEITNWFRARKNFYQLSSDIIKGCYLLNKSILEYKSTYN